MSSSRHAAKERGRAPSDESGEVSEREIARLGHRVLKRDLISDDTTMIKEAVEKFVSGEGDVLVFLGGTGIARRDVTIEAVKPFFEKEIEGFGELLRSSSLGRIGAAAMLTRATAGVVQGKLVLCLPGSPDAARVAFRRFGGELPHALFVARS